jgi:hypothetical protein
MNKINLTKFILDELALPSDEKNLKKYLIHWWRNILDKNSGGLGLTEQGFEAFSKANIKIYKIKLSKTIICNNRLIVRLDNFINSPFYLTRNWIYVFDERTAIELILYDCDLEKFTHNKAKILDSKL